MSPTIRLGPLVSDFMAGLDLLAGFLTGAPLNLAIPSPEIFVLKRTVNYLRGENDFAFLA